MTVKVWDALGGTLVKTLNSHTDWVTAVSTFTDAKTGKVYVVSGSNDGTVKVWDALGGTLVKTLSGHTHVVNAVSTFTDAKTGKVYVVSGSDDKTVKVWDALGGTLVKTLSGHTHALNAVSTFTDDITQKQKKEALYNELIPYIANNVINAYVLPYTLPPTTISIVSGSYDETIKIWSLDNYSDSFIKDS